MICNQKKMWEKIFRGKNFSLETNRFAKECIKYFPKKSKILELGCGVRVDSIFFSSQGHKITAIDFSRKALEKAKRRTEDMELKNLDFLYQDISKKFKFNDASFDVVYAHLSLHYFTDNVTEKIFIEIRRVLKTKGIFCLCCKSIKDPLYGKGKKIEKDMYILNEHVRHFFSKKYLRDKVKGKFKIIKLWSGVTKFYKRESAFIKIVAEKIP